MGYNTTVLFLNDMSFEYRNHPDKVIANILDAMSNISEPDKDYYPQMQALATAHADEYRLYVSHGNFLAELGYRSNVTRLEHRKVLVKEAKRLIKREEEEIRRLEKEADAK